MQSQQSIPHLHRRCTCCSVDNTCRYTLHLAVRSTAQRSPLVQVQRHCRLHRVWHRTEAVPCTTGVLCHPSPDPFHAPTLTITLSSGHLAGHVSAIGPTFTEQGLYRIRRAVLGARGPTSRNPRPTSSIGFHVQERRVASAKSESCRAVSAMAIMQKSCNHAYSTTIITQARGACLSARLNS